MKRALKDNQEAFAGQEFYIGIDVHQKQWTISIQSNQIALAKWKNLGTLCLSYSCWSSKGWRVQRGGERK